MRSKPKGTDGPPYDQSLIMISIFVCKKCKMFKENKCLEGLFNDLTRYKKTLANTFKVDTKDKDLEIPVFEDDFYIRCPMIKDHIKCKKIKKLT